MKPDVLREGLADIDKDYIILLILKGFALLVLFAGLLLTGRYFIALMMLGVSIIGMAVALAVLGYVGEHIYHAIVSLL